MKHLLLVPAALSLAGAGVQPATIDLQVERLRNLNGTLLVCVTGSPTHFPDCSRDPDALKRTVSASTRTLRLNDVRTGRYAVTIVHDENGNRKLDMVFGIPREGFGFSRNPVIRFGAPRFSQVHIELPPGLSRHSVRMQYLL